MDLQQVQLLPRPSEVGLRNRNSVWNIIMLMSTTRTWAEEIRCTSTQPSLERSKQNQEFVWRSRCPLHVRAQFAACFCVFHFLCPCSRMRHSGSRYPSDFGHMIWSMCGRGQYVRKGNGFTEEAGGSDSGLVYVTLTENSEGHVGVSGESDTPTSPAPPPSPPTTVSLLMASPHTAFPPQSCLVHLTH